MLVFRQRKGGNNKAKRQNQDGWVVLAKGQLRNAKKQQHSAQE